MKNSSSDPVLNLTASHYLKKYNKFDTILHSHKSILPEKLKNLLHTSRNTTAY